MKIKELLKKRLLPVTAGAVVVALAAAGVSYASTPSTTATPATSATAAASTVNPGHLRADVVWLARHTIHAQLVVNTKQGFETIDIDRGRLQSATSSTVTIVRADHAVVSATITSSTKFIGLPESQLAKGDRVVLVQHGGYALYVGARLPRATSASA